MTPRPRRRRLIIQLAALVDLLFVVMFLQYAEQVQNARKQSVGIQLAAAHSDEQLRKRNDTLQNEVEALKGQLATETKKTAGMQKQLQEIGAVAKESLAGVDPEAVRAALRGASADDVSAILAALNETKGKNTVQVIQMLRTSAEVKNWCDIWEVHLFDDGRVRVRPPRLNDQFIQPNDEQDFKSKFMQIVSDAGSPKPLVIIMFTHGNAFLKQLDVLSKGLELVQDTWSKREPNVRIQKTAPKYTAVAP
jgi:hypothetical protein